MKPSKHCGWFPIHEEAIRIIERTFDGEGARRKAIAALVAVSRIANLERTNTFTRPISSIARDMSYSYGHAAEALALLETAGLLKIKGQTVPGSKEKAPSIYTLLQNGGTVGTKKGKVTPAVKNPAMAENSQAFPKQHLIHPFQEITP
jgi:hypothetical protein